MSSKKEPKKEKVTWNKLRHQWLQEQKEAKLEARRRENPTTMDKIMMMVDNISEKIPRKRSDEHQISNFETAPVKEIVINKIGIENILKFLIWALLYFIFIKLEFGVVYFIVSLLVIMYLNTGKRRSGEKSAYSVFNRDCEELPGTLKASQFEKEIMHRFD